MLTNQLATDKFGDIFPQLESILQCGVFRYDYQKNETFWSPGIFDILGFPRNTKPASTDEVYDLIVENDRTRVREAVELSRSTGVPFSIEYSIIDAKGVHKRVHAQNFYRENTGQHLVYEGVLRDITENYQYKLALEEKIRLLDKSNQNLQEFAYIASHDLQEPLRKISTFAGRLKSKSENELGEEGNMFLGRILNSTVNMQTLLEDLLSFSRLSFSDKPITEVSLNNCVKSAISELEVKIEDLGAKIIIDDLPNIKGFESQLCQLFSNLLNNAIKFRNVEVSPLINISAKIFEGNDIANFPRKGQQYVEICIQDNGIGFESEYAEKIFMIFQRLNGRAEYPGSGVGLAICKKIVENHHGKISATGIPEKGARFTVILPLK